MYSFKEFVAGSQMNPAEYGIYASSIHTGPNGETVYMADLGDSDCLVAPESAGFHGEVFKNAAGEAWVAAPLTHENAVVLRSLFPFTAPVAVLKNKRTIGVGDRLGIATPGHLRVFRRYDALPILAQQSIRELTLTRRDYNQVLDCASFAVFREDFQRGFGADGDHLKTPEEITYALSCGFTMITLDCSEHIRNDITDMSEQEVLDAYQAYPTLEAKYIGKTIALNDKLSLTCGTDDFRRMALIYGEAIDFIDSIYHQFIEGKSIDFEISIDETQTPTTPLQHYFVANELTARGIRFDTMAPRFCGEFQKGVNYIGDLEQFSAELEEHAAIADLFGYKISVHSGSDKFDVFPAVGRLTAGRFHVKTAGTNWLEAMKLVAMKAPALYRQIHAFALDAFADARRFYHVTTDLAKIPALDTLSDEELPALFDQNDARQLIHITYGSIFTAEDKNGAPLFSDRLFSLWREYAEEYARLLDSHIGKHLELLYSQIPVEK